MMVHQIVHFPTYTQPDRSSVTTHMLVCHTPYPSVADLYLPFGPILSPVVFPKHMYVPITDRRRGCSVITAHCLVLCWKSLNLSLDYSLKQNEINSNENNMNRLSCFVIHIVPCITNCLFKWKDCSILRSHSVGRFLHALVIFKAFWFGHQRQSLSGCWLDKW